MVFAIACMNCQWYVHSMVNWSTLKSDHSICGISKLASWGLLAVQIQHEQPLCTGWRPNMLQIFFVNILVARPSLLNKLLVESRPWNCFGGCMWDKLCCCGLPILESSWDFVERSYNSIHMISHVDYIAMICHMSSGRSLFSHMCAWGQS